MVWILVLLMAVLLGCNTKTGATAEPPAAKATTPTRPAAAARVLPTATAVPQLDLLSVNGNRDGQYAIVVGEVQNNGERAVRFVKAVVTHYDAAGNILDTDTTYITVQGNTLQPGQRGPFKSMTRFKDGMATYHVEVEGR